MIEVSIVTLADNLTQLVDEINQASWDDANEMATYEVAPLSAYLERQDTLFVVCHEVAEGRKTLLGVASGRFEPKPYGNERWLYVDEVDVCANQRQRGAGKAIMRKLIALAEEAGCEEVWLATEDDNHAANALYRSLDPDDIGKVVGYTFETGE